MYFGLLRRKQQTKNQQFSDKQLAFQYLTLYKDSAIKMGVLKGASKELDRLFL